MNREASLKWVQQSQPRDGSGSKIFDPGRVGPIFCGWGQIRSGQPFMVWV